RDQQRGQLSARARARTRAVTATHPATRRRGALLPLVALCLVALVAFVALAVDLTLLTLGRAQCQNVADGAAMAAARTLDGNGSTNTNAGAARAAGSAAATNNSILGQPVTADQVSVRVGVLSYDRTASPPAFTLSGLTADPQTPPAGSNWGA